MSIPGIPDLPDAFEPYPVGEELPKGLTPPTQDISTAPVAAPPRLASEPGQRKEKPVFVPGSAPGEGIFWTAFIACMGAAWPW